MVDEPALPVPSVRPLTARLAWLSPLACGAAAIAAIDAARANLFLAQIPPLRALAAFDPSAIGSVGDFATRIHWGVATAAFVLLIGALGILCIQASVHVLYGESRAYDRWMVTVIAVVFVLGGSWLVLAEESRVALTFKPVSGLFNSLYALHPPPKVPDLRANASVMGRLAVGATLVLAVALSLLLLPIARQDEELQLRLRIAALRRLLYAGGATLAAAVIQVRSTYAFLPTYLPAESAKQAQEVVNVVSAAIGSYWTIVLLALYIPATAWLRGCAVDCFNNATQATGGDVKGLEEWLDTRGLALSVRQQLGRFAALFAPFLAGAPLSELLNLLHSG